MSDQSAFNPSVEPIGVTIKYGKGYEDAWITIRGTEPVVREQLVKVFDISPEESEGVSLAGLILNAANVAHALNNLGGKNEGRAISGNRGGRGRSNPDAWKDGDKPAEAKPEKDPHELAVEKALKEIEEVSSIADIKRWWAENQEIFKDDRVAAGYKAKGKALQAAEAAKQREAEAAQ